ncbi:hypothetical protein CJD38_08660 [Stenotrophobium rhamnosiphilum]|uniref:DUF3261 domain-containing protein n=1 Tax=Stenotrophobium rhamnosiphilum TaxID=2029166 RepID=A0A2T5MFP9_9GAMM|nr:hypothetical protein CJD38_08660 [Stenotrophobium rhamnosiphilum]
MLATLMLCGCATLGSSATPPGNSAPLQPLSAASLGQTRSAVQVVRAAFGKQEVTMQFAVDVSPERMRVIALNALGLRLFSISAENGKTTVERAPGVPEQVQPEQILRDIQFCYWPIAALQAGMKGTPWEVTEPFAGTRRLKRDGRLIAEVHYAQSGKDLWRGHLWLSNFEYGYSLAVDPAPTDSE